MSFNRVQIVSHVIFHELKYNIKQLKHELFTSQNYMNETNTNNMKKTLNTSFHYFFLNWRILKVSTNFIEQTVSAFKNLNALITTITSFTCGKCNIRIKHLEVYEVPV